MTNQLTFRLIVLAFAVLPGITARSQENSGKQVLRLFDKIQVTPIADAQLWATYTHGTQIVDTLPGEFIEVGDRVNFTLRRTRLGLKVKPHENLTFELTTAIDLVGRDILAGYGGGANNGAFPQVGIWNAYAKWRIKSGSEAFYLIGGYFVPRFSRESITPWHQVSTMDKLASQLYIRRHMVGIGPGRAIGFDFGGMLKLSESFLLRYDAGVHNPSFSAPLLNSVGVDAAVLFTGRVEGRWGDLDNTTYPIMHSPYDIFDGRGIALAFSGMYTGSTDVFDNNTGISVDVLGVYGIFVLQGELAFLGRSGSRTLDDESLRNFTYVYNTGFVRAGLLFELDNGSILEPQVGITWFEGAKTEVEQKDAIAVGSPSGSTYALDLGVNWHLIPNRVIFNLHYNIQDADAGEAGPGGVQNELIVRSGTLIQRGNWLGLGVILRM